MNPFKRKSNNNIIKFKASSRHVMEVRDKPQPASKFLPDWWKTMPHYSSATNTLELSPYPSVTSKRCLSALDGLAAGYIVPLWCDVQVFYSEKDGTSLKWATGESPFDVWDDLQVSTYEIPKECSKPVFKYQHGWIIDTPSGWSSLIIHPVAYPNLPFKVIPGVVDTDNLPTLINTPLIFEKGFEGILEKGTPMFQVIPLRRSNWESEYELQDPLKLYFDIEKIRSKIVSFYGRYQRVPKSYK